MPPVITKAPVVVELESVDSPSSTFPLGAQSAYEFVNVTLVPAVGALSMYIVAALVIVTLVLEAAIVACANELIVALAAVPEEAVLVFV